MRGAIAWRHDSSIALVDPPERVDTPARIAPTGGSGVRRDLPQLTEKIDLLKSMALTLLYEVRALNGAATIDIQNGIDFYEEVRRFETELIKLALEQTGGHQIRAARLLGLKVTTLNSIIKRYQITCQAPADEADEADENPQLSNVSPT